MFKFLGTLVKTLVFGAVALVIGQIATFQGRTLSDHVRMLVNLAQKTAPADVVRRSVNTWGDTMSMSHSQARTERNSPAKETLSASERQELRRLLEKSERR